jgi:hypothetical protein
MNLDNLKTALRSDNDYRSVWISNIAMSYLDIEKSYKDKTHKKYLNKQDRHIIANDAAKNFIQILLQDDVEYFTNK